MLNVWPILVVGVEIGLIIAVAAFAFVQFCVAPIFEKASAKAEQQRRWPER
jgi:hypothetical protein